MNAVQINIISASRWKRNIYRKTCSLPFPDLVFSKASKTFEAYVVDKSNPAVIALHDAAEEICKDSDRPGRKRKKPANAI